MKRSTEMKKAIICTFALSLFALPMSLHANPPAKGEAPQSKIVKPLSAMKSTVASPSKSTEASTKAAKSSEKEDAAKKAAEDAEKAGAKKAAGK